MDLVINNEHLLRHPSLPVSQKEGREIARRLSAWLERNNRKATAPLKLYERKTDSFGRTHRNPRRPSLALGIAAPQLGMFKRVAVVSVGGGPVVLINPRVTARSDSLLPWTESCLSFPGREVDTYRYAWVEVICNHWLAPERFGPRTPEDWTRAKLLASVCVQHEIGHLAGLLIFDCTTRDYPDPLTWFD